MLRVSEISSFEVKRDGRCVIDLTDVGEVAYRFPNVVAPTIFDVLCADRFGEGNYEYWRQRIRPLDKTGTCVVLGDCETTPKLMEMFTSNECYRVTTLADTLQSLITWLRKQGYPVIELVVTRRNLGTSMEKVIESLK